MKKIITMMLAIILSVGTISTVSVKAAALQLGRPSNLSIETKDNSYNVTFKNSNEMRKIKNTNDIKVELDIKVDKKDWSSKKGKVIVKNYNDNVGKSVLVLTKDELRNFVNTDANNYSIRARYALKNQKGDFSGYVTVGSVGIYENSSKWAEEYLLKAQKLGLISDDMKNDMKKNITREEFAELIVKASDKANIASSHITSNNFKDTDNKYVSYAQSLNFMNGVSDTMFFPKKELKKQDMAVSIDRMLNDVKSLNSKNINIADRNKISNYALKSVDLLISNNILNLDGKKNFNPDKNVTREEAVVSIMRAIA